MSENPELDALAAEAEPEFEAEPGIGHNGAPEAEPAADPGLAIALAMLAALVGNLVCARYRVLPLTDDESRAIGQAAALVAAHYDISGLDPKAAAWIGLGFAVGAAAAPRVLMARQTVDGEAETVAEGAEESEAPDDDELDQTRPPNIETADPSAAA